jgi:hypothetical protein
MSPALFRPLASTVVQLLRNAPEAPHRHQVSVGMQIFLAEMLRIAWVHYAIVLTFPEFH